MKSYILAKSNKTNIELKIDHQKISEIEQYSEGIISIIMLSGKTIKIVGHLPLYLEFYNNWALGVYELMNDEKFKDFGVEEEDLKLPLNRFD